MITLRKIISEIIDDLKGINLDDRISYRFIANKFFGKIEYFLRLEAKSREFAKSQNLWQSINCIELKDVDLTSCNFIDECSILKRSVDTIPEAFATNYGLLLKILTIDGKQTFKLVANSSELKDYKNRRWGTKDLKVVYLENNYLFVPDLDIDNVKVLLIPKNPYDVDKANGLLTDCSSPLDAQISYPPYLVTLAKKEVLQELAGVYKHIVEDEKGDDDTNQKN